MSNFIQNHIGELAALFTAICWTATSIFFEQASKKTNSFAINIIRLVLALVFLSVFCLVVYKRILPFNASLHSIIWLSISGLIGFTLGDLFLFEAFVLIGARVSMLIMALAPPLAAIIGFFFFQETMSIKSLFGMILTLTGITFVILERNNKTIRINKKQLFIGILLAFGGAVGQALGLNLSKFGMSDLDPFSSTQIRVIAGIVGFIIAFSFMKVWSKVLISLKNREAMTFASLGAFFGPFLGVSFSLLAIKHTSTGVASTIMALPPVLIIPVAVFILKEKISIKEVFSSFIAVAGTVIFFI